MEHPSLPRTVVAAGEAELRAVMEQDPPRPGDGGAEGEADCRDGEVERLRRELEAGRQVMLHFLTYDLQNLHCGECTPCSSETKP